MTGCRKVSICPFSPEHLYQYTISPLCVYLT